MLVNFFTFNKGNLMDNSVLQTCLKNPTKSNTILIENYFSNKIIVKIFCLFHYFCFPLKFMITKRIINKIAKKG